MYDPLGTLLPVQVQAKIFIQKLWQLQIDWDTPLDDDITKEWLAIREELKSAQNITLQRSYFLSSIREPCELHVFADASTKAYGACAYLKCGEECTLVIAKSRVTPLKGMTVPRLELLAAFVATRLAAFIKKTLNHLEIQKPVLWCDSQIVLHWIKRR